MGRSNWDGDKMKNPIIGMMLGIAVISPNSASSRTMGEMMQHCINATIPEATDQYFMQGLCMGVVRGIYYVAGDIRICSPKGTTIGDMVRHVVIYAANNPQLNNKDFSEVALGALSKKFPCQSL